MEQLKKFSQEKDEEGRKQEYLARKQGTDEDLRKYYLYIIIIMSQKY